jgi:hypothetical protein
MQRGDREVGEPSAALAGRRRTRLALSTLGAKPFSLLFARLDGYGGHHARVGI